MGRYLELILSGSVLAMALGNAFSLWYLPLYLVFAPVWVPFLMYVSAELAKTLLK